MDFPDPFSVPHPQDDAGGDVLRHGERVGGVHSGGVSPLLGGGWGAEGVFEEGDEDGPLR